MLKYIRILLMVLLVFFVGVLVGFFIGQLPPSSPELVDSDHDGYPDTVDDGPYDARYHEKNKTAELRLNIGDPWTQKELAPLIGSQYTGILLTIYTSGPDIDVELFTQSNETISSVWTYRYDGMDPEVSHEYLYFFNQDTQEHFDKLVLTNPSPGDSFSVTVTLYTLR